MEANGEASLAENPQGGPRNLSIEKGPPAVREAGAARLRLQSRLRFPTECPPPASTKDFGTKWAKLNASLAISGPSAVVPDERNYLVNPLHPDFALIRFRPPKPFVFDRRLK
jgi:RES domain-containing protein